MVHEIENIVPGSSSIFFTSVDLPDPEGPETINDQWIRRNPPSSFDVLHLFAQFFDLRFHFQPQLRHLEPVLVRARSIFESSVFASRCISCSRKSSFLPISPPPFEQSVGIAARGFATAQFPRWCRCVPRANAASCARRAGSSRVTSQQFLQSRFERFAQTPDARARQASQSLRRVFRRHASAVAQLFCPAHALPRAASRPTRSMACRQARAHRRRELLHFLASGGSRRAPRRASRRIAITSGSDFTPNSSPSARAAAKYAAATSRLIATALFFAACTCSVTSTCPRRKRSRTTLPYFHFQRVTSFRHSHAHVQKSVIHAAHAQLHGPAVSARRAPARIRSSIAAWRM